MEFTDSNMLLLLTLVWCGSLLVATLRASVKRYGWIAMSAATIVLAVAARLAGFADVGHGVFCWFLVAFALPLVGSFRARKLVMNQRYRAASRWSALSALLHPCDGFPAQRKAIAALADAIAGDVTRADALATCWGAPSASREQAAMVPTMLRITGRWQELWDHSVAAGALSAPRENVVAATNAMRAAVELNRPAVVCETYRAIDGAAGNSGLPQMTADLFFLVACGDVPSAERLLDKRAFGLPAAMRRYWLALAASAGPPESKDERSEMLARELDVAEQEEGAASVGRLFAHRRQAGPLTVDVDVRLDGAETIRRIDERTATMVAPAPAVRPIVTFTFAALLLAVFVAQVLVAPWPEALGDIGRDEEALHRLGALVPLHVGDDVGQWWRVLTSPFLHFGWMHFSLNTFALLLFGPYVERSLGRWRMSLVYLTTAFLSMGGLALAMAFDWMRPSAALGASGAVMGLVGATGVLALRAWRRGVPFARRRLVTIIALVVVQTALDAVVVQVSMTAHLIGLFAGALLAFVLDRATLREKG